MNTSVNNINISLPDALISSLIGFSLVFLILFVLILFIKLLSFFISKAEKKKELKTEAEAVAADNSAEEAKGSCGSVKLYGVPDKTAAMLMAITADKLGEPLNKLRFISIREVSDEENTTK